MDRAVRNRRGPTYEVKPSSGVYFMNDEDLPCVDISRAPIKSPVPIPEVTIEQLAAENTRLREELEAAIETVHQLRRQLNLRYYHAMRHARGFGWMSRYDVSDECNADAAIDWMSDQLHDAQKDPDEVQADIVSRLSELEETVDGLVSQI